MRHLEEANNPLWIGWREWVSLPDLSIKRIKAKIDTGARTSSLHAFDIEPYRARGKSFLHFSLHPFKQHPNRIVRCHAEWIDLRWVTDSGGGRERRYVIVTHLCLGHLKWLIEMTLTNRGSMQYLMLLGRTAMRDRVLIDPSASFLLGK